jgi:CubicO group peptidase (beta-lactamase class C family)
MLLSVLLSLLPAEIERVIVEEELTGAVWSTAAPDGSVSVGAAGVKHAGTGVPLRADDRVHIGSVTKTLLAAGVLRLVTERRFTLDTPVSALLPDSSFDNPWSATDPVRVRHLLDHTAGLDDARLWQVFSLRPTPDTPLAASFAGDPPLLRIRSRPGARFSYSNMGYTLLGMLIETVTSERYERYLDDHLLRPLAMRDSTFAFVSQVGKAADARLAMGHFENGVMHAAVPIYLRPSAQFTTTAADMARFARFLMSDGRVDGVTFIESNLLRAMGTPHETEAARAGLRVGYGLGLATRDRHGAIGRCHGGNTVGFRAMLCMFPESGTAFFIALNADSETADYARFDALLIDAIGVTGALPAQPAAPAQDLGHWQGLYVPAPNRFASFEWLDTVFGFVRIRWDGQHLQLRSLQTEARSLIPVGAHMFRAANRLTASHVLLHSAEGDRVLSDGLQTFERTTWIRMTALWASLAAGLAGLAAVLAMGAARLWQRSLRPGDPLFAPFLGTIALAVPVPLFFSQSFLQLGEVTAASISLALVTAALPAAVLIGLALRMSQGVVGRTALLESAALAGVLQLSVVLAVSGLIPLRLWT